MAAEIVRYVLQDNVGAANAKVNEQLQKLKVKEHAVEELKYEIDSVIAVSNVPHRHKLAEFEEVSKINEKIKSTVVEMRWVIAKVGTLPTVVR
jgi:hypothetical protein